MQDFILKYKTKYDKLSFREQVMLAVSVFVLIGLVWFLYLYEPLYLQTKEVSSELQSLKLNIEKISEKKNKLIARRASDPHRELKKRITSVRNNLDKINTVLNEKFHALVEPKEMAKILESVLKQHSTLRLLSVKSLPAEPLITNKESVNKAETSPEESNVEVYRHGLQIELNGNYLAVLKYLQTLEALDWEFYWDAVSFEVIEYPQASIYITVYTLSLRDSWIGV